MSQSLPDVFVLGPHQLYLTSVNQIKDSAGECAKQASICSRSLSDAERENCIRRHPGSSSLLSGVYRGRRVAGLRLYSGNTLTTCGRTLDDGLLPSICPSARAPADGKKPAEEGPLLHLCPLKTGVSEREEQQRGISLIFCTLQSICQSW